MRARPVRLAGQRHAVQRPARAVRLEREVKATGDPTLLRDWRRLQASDHFYYMCTKYFADGDVHKYFNPYESPYDSYINFMNVLDNLRSRVQAKRKLPTLARSWPDPNLWCRHPAC